MIWVLFVGRARGMVGKTTQKVSPLLSAEMWRIVRRLHGRTRDDVLARRRDELDQPSPG